MPTSPPLLSIIIPVGSDALGLGPTIQSCVDQSLASIEIICVVDQGASDSLKNTLPDDGRIRVIAHKGPQSTFDACRAGVFASEAPYLLFLRAGDELMRDAVSTTHRKAGQFDADIVEFGIEIVASVPGESPVPGGKPQHPRLGKSQILLGLFPPAAPVDSKIWGFAFRTELLRDVYTALPIDEVSPLGAAPELPLLLLASAAAESYVSFEKPVYRLFASRNSEESTVIAGDRSRRALKTLDALDAVAPTVRNWARRRSNPEPLLDAYASTRLAVIGHAVEVAQEMSSPLREEVLGTVCDRVDSTDLVLAAAAFAADALGFVSAFARPPRLGERMVRSVLLTTNVLTTGGVSSVLLSQARALLEAGYRVTIAAHRAGSDVSMVPEGASLVEVVGSGRRERLPHWVALCREFDVDLVIDHRIMYSRDWAAYALVGNSMDIATIGWVHAFSGRPTYNGTDLLSLLQKYLSALTQLMVLSPLDVAFWKLRGIERVAFLPNPPSSIMVDTPGRVTPRPAPGSRRLELIWWGRLDESTKKVTQLIEVASALKRAGTDFRLRIVGPGWDDMTTTRLASLARKKGVESFVEVTGPRHGQSLLETIDSSDIFINTSIIEGFLLTIPEAQSRGLPVVMYDLPWLLPVQQNSGVISVPQGDFNALARAVVELANDPERYETLSRVSIEAAGRASATDFADLYQKLVLGDLPAEYSPNPTLESGRQILDLLIYLAEHRLAPAPNKTGVAGRRRAANTAPRTLAAKLERRLTSPGRRLIRRAPWLRPAARKVKSLLLRADARQKPPHRERRP